MKRIILKAAESAAVITVSTVAGIYAAHGTRYVFKHLRDYVEG